MDDVSKYLTLFVSEASEHGEQLARGFALASAAGAGGPGDAGPPAPGGLDELFRHAHSIKGMSAAMGFDEIVSLAHAAEQLLAEVRQRASPLPPAAAESLLGASDQLLAMIRARGRGDKLPAAPDLEAAVAGALQPKSEAGFNSGSGSGGSEVEASGQPRNAAGGAPGDLVGAVKERVRGARVRTELLDGLLEGAGELLTDVARVRALARRLESPEGTAVEEGLDRLQRQARALHGRVTEARLTPLSILTSQLPRHVREIARRTGRAVELEVSGAEAEIDRSLVEDLADVLLHLLRNCIDHGIEPSAERRALGKRELGRLRVDVERERDSLRIEVSDDGRGFDGERLRQRAVAAGRIGAADAAALTPQAVLRLACLPGVTTASEVTDISGRGIGLDAVLSTVEGLGGSLAIDSSPGAGTTFRLRLPLSLALLPILLAEVAGEVVALPMARVQAALDLPPPGNDLDFDGRRLPLRPLAKLLGFGEGRASGTGLALVVGQGDEVVAVAVDRLVGQQEAVVKPLSRPLDAVAGLSGVAMLASGQPVFILELSRLGNNEAPHDAAVAGALAAEPA